MGRSFSGVVKRVSCQSCACPMTESTAIATDGDVGGVMEESVENDHGQDGVREEVAPIPASKYEFTAVWIKPAV